MPALGLGACKSRAPAVEPNGGGKNKSVLPSPFSPNCNGAWEGPFVGVNVP